VISSGLPKDMELFPNTSTSAAWDAPVSAAWAGYR